MSNSLRLLPALEHDERHTRYVHRDGDSHESEDGMGLLLSQAGILLRLVELDFFEHYVQVGCKVVERLLRWCRGGSVQRCVEQQRNALL
eukprot:3919858-Pyramimonas_sp.AAC.1